MPFCIIDAWRSTTKFICDGFFVSVNLSLFTSPKHLTMTFQEMKKFSLAFFVMKNLPAFYLLYARALLEQMKNHEMDITVDFCDNFHGLNMQLFNEGEQKLKGGVNKKFCGSVSIEIHCFKQTYSWKKCVENLSCDLHHCIPESFYRNSMPKVIKIKVLCTLWKKTDKKNQFLADSFST